MNNVGFFALADMAIENPTLTHLNVQKQERAFMIMEKLNVNAHISHHETEYFQLT